MNYTLKGSISRTQPYQLDPTLTVEGTGAEAKATGEAIKKVKEEANAHATSTSNPHNVTKEQLGLNEVDNTSDMDKPVSYAQAEAIADAKMAGINAQNAIDEAIAAIENAQTTADTAQTTADEAKTSANEAKTAADNAQATADSKTSLFTAKVTLYLVDWNENKLTVNVPGVTANENQPIFVTPTPASEEAYNLFEVKPIEQSENTITFSCAEAPESDIVLNIVGFIIPA